jgi:hypothetical protein
MEAARSPAISANLYRHLRFKSYSTENRTLPKNIKHWLEVELYLNFEVDVKPYVHVGVRNTSATTQWVLPTQRLASIYFYPVYMFSS